MTIQSSCGNEPATRKKIDRRNIFDRSKAFISRSESCEYAVVVVDLQNAHHPWTNSIAKNPRNNSDQAVMIAFQNRFVAA